MAKAWRFGNNIDTDLIIAARYLNTVDPQELAKRLFEDADADFTKKAAKGDYVVALDNFGCGSSREHAPIAIKAFGIAGVIAKSYARIFYRNAFNTGLYIYEVDQADRIENGDEVEVDNLNAIVKNLTKNETYKFNPIPPFMQEIVDAGGLMSYAKKEIAQMVSA
ncbi:MAG: 3-isopropylmalate dehydratase small subunit [Helicobacteraceae bacterium]|jgi:3-isopropylmalate/(R)-2-methylmalate dehydratase small subunit|nr:3-isopropylmalate dehydratase small subunit [Helicobacteraceae bacterium]